MQRRYLHIYMSKCSLVIFCDSEKEKYPPLLGSKMMESRNAEKTRDCVVSKRDGHQVAPGEFRIIILGVEQRPLRT